MAKMTPATTKNSPAVKVGSNKNTLPAEKYATPHDMSGNPVPGGLPAAATETGTNYMNRMNISTGTVSKGNYSKTKTDGVAQRGKGAAVKGFTSRGPLG